MVKSVPSQWLQETWNKWVQESTGKDKFMASGDNQRGGQAQNNKGLFVYDEDWKWKTEDLRTTNKIERVFIL